MRTRYLSPLALLALILLPAPPLAAGQKPQPAPTVVVRLRSLDTLFETGKLVASFAGKEELIQQIQDLLKSKAGPDGLKAVDMKRPFGLYARIGADLSDLQAVVVLPVADEKGFLTLLDNLGFTPKKGVDGLYTVKQNFLPVDVHLRFAHKYAYLTPLGPEVLAPAALVEPSKLFPGKQTAALSLTMRVDQVPDMAKQFVVEQLGGHIRTALDKKEEGESEAQYAFRAQLLKEIEKHLAMALRDGTELNAEVDVDAKTSTLTADLTLGAKSGSEFADTLSKLGQAKSLFGGLMHDSAALNVLVHAPLPDKIKTVLQSVVDEAAGKVLAATSDETKKKQARRLLDALAPTFQTGEIDLAVSLRGPDVSKRYTLVAGVKVREAEKVALIVAELIQDLPESERKQIQLNVEKVAGVGIHKLDLGKSFDARVKALIDEGPVYVAFRPDAVFVAAG
ncbi:MAG: hypothetical protein L0Z62_47845, partial [Gemmataceae bacterium]|nr:hypothetical protein [Gemmataceae bacterium]